MPLGSAPLVGLDVGTSALRAARVNQTRSGYSLAAFAQAPLPDGAVVDGQVQDRDAVSSAISALWKKGKLGSDRVVVGLANHRVVVRPIELPFLEERELRESIKYQVADHIPMSVDEAEFDFQILGDHTDEDGEHRMSVLLIAAATDVVESLVQTVESAGLDVAAVDLSAFAIARAVSPVARGEIGATGAQAIVDVGAGITEIVIHAGEEPRFVRISLIGGDSITRALARELDMELAAAEALKFDLKGGVSVPEAYEIVAREVDVLVEEISGSLDYYSTREGALEVSSVLLTGGGALSQGLLQKLELGLKTEVKMARPLEGVKSKLSDDRRASIEPLIGTAMGLSMWRGDR